MNPLETAKAALRTVAADITKMGEFYSLSPFVSTDLRIYAARIREALTALDAAPREVTHHAECWREHHACAVARLEAMASPRPDDVETLKAAAMCCEIYQWTGVAAKLHAMAGE